MPTLPCDTFEAAFDAVSNGAAELAMLPCENSLAGRVPDIHSLLPGSGLHIVGEHFQRVEHCLLGLPGATVAESAGCTRMPWRSARSAIWCGSWACCRWWRRTPPAPRR